MRAFECERGRSPTPTRFGLWALLAGLALGCASEASAGGYFDPRGEVFVSPQFTAEELAVVESAISAWHEATQGEVDFRVRIGDGFPGIAPAREGQQNLGEFSAGESPQITLDTRKAANAPALRNVALHELGHALGLGHIAHNDSVMFPFATTVQELDAWTLAAFRTRRDAAPVESDR